MLEFHVHSISPLHSNDFQLLCSIYIGLHKLQTPYALPLSIIDEILTPNMSYWTQKHRIYLLASYNKWMHTCMEQEIT